MDQKEFRKACYEAARRTDGQVTEFLPSERGQNYEQCGIAYRHRTVAVLWTREWREGAKWDGIALAESPAWFGSPSFVDEPGLLAVLAELLPRARMFTRAELEGPLDLAVWPWISERKVRTHRPGNLGEALFNFWD
ncbi:hypothetical protein SAMN04489729_4849 [Amycolatopsis lurida]|nr:hypothetical protein [Amycolatopsis lurida]SED62356.1 hypothetical protein SAMN04489729_4849 [Amycolatopsis lurida]